jgi:hypothetical protein
VRAQSAGIGLVDRIVACKPVQVNAAAVTNRVTVDEPSRAAVIVAVGEQRKSGLNIGVVAPFSPKALRVSGSTRLPRIHINIPAQGSELVVGVEVVLRVAPVCLAGVALVSRQVVPLLKSRPTP